jgi:FkbM family methyltransferase
MIAKLSAYLNRFCFNRINRREYLLEDLFRSHREKIVKEMYTYPSFINNGYLHFEKLFEIAGDFGLTGREGLILDVGGADGVTAVKFHETFKSAKVYVFEPIEDNATGLKKNILPFKRITFFQKALGSEKKQTEIHITKRVTSSSLFPVNTAELREDYMSSQLVPERKQKVELDRVDNIVQPGETVLVMKLDVQGFELEVLKGAEKTLKHTKLVMAELQNHRLYEGAPMYYDIDAFLRKNNFTLLQNVPSLREGHKQLEWDAIYINNDLL